VVIPGIADLPCSYYPLTGHYQLFRLVGFLLLIPLASLAEKASACPLAPALVGGLALACSTLAHSSPASALGFATGQVAIVSVLASLSSAVAVVLTAIFLRERLHVIQWLGMSMLLAGVVLTHVERICYTQPIGTNPHASTSPLERRSGGILLS
jgi:drug/metabolite transporter (DMT)-like permease